MGPFSTRVPGYQKKELSTVGPEVFFGDKSTVKQCTIGIMHNVFIYRIEKVIVILACSKREYLILSYDAYISQSETIVISRTLL